MEDLASYNRGCKAVSPLITILANVVIYRLLTRDALGLGSTHTHTTAASRHGAKRPEQGQHACGPAPPSDTVRRGW